MPELDYQWMQPTGGTLTQRVADLVTKNIELQNLMPGDKLPTERELAVALGIARGTVKAAYHLLERDNIIRTRQGSGSYVIRDEQLARKIRREKAVDILTRTVATLQELGLESGEISRLFELCLSQEPGKAARVAVIYDSAELLLDLKRQLSYLPNIMISIFITESITENQHPEELLQGYDLIVIPSDQYPRIAALLPELSERLVEAAVAPSGETLVALTALPRTARIGIICRTNLFLSRIKELLLSYGFEEENILSFFEMHYTTETYFPGGIDALISFSDAHIFTNPAFAFRNEEFLAKGGKILTMKYQFERGTLIYIEDRVRGARSRLL